MTLFAALTAKEGDANGGTSSTSSPPEVIQLHSNRVIDFLSGTTVHLLKKSSKSSGEESNKEESGANNKTTNTIEGQSRYFSALSYQAIQTQQDDGPLPNKSAGGGAAAAVGLRHLRPDLGVWDCRVNENKEEASAMLLKRVVLGTKKQQPKEDSGEEKKGEETEAAGEKDEAIGVAPPIVMTVDLSNPADVQPVVERMRSVILEVYDSDEKASSNKNPQVQCSTSIKALQSSTFGKTHIQEEVTVKGGSTSNDEKIALILAVIVPSAINTTASSSAAEEYKERQARALLLYHLHKFSLEVDCTLCFVSGSGSPDIPSGGVEAEAKEAETASAENDPLLGRNTTMSIDELGKVIRRVAMGLSPVEQSDNAGENEEAKEDSKGEDDNGSPSQRPPSIHVPGSHDAELIHGAYLRNASCEGRWDASKDDLNVALPPTPSKDSSENKSSNEGNTASGGGGDEEWLSQLASSIGLSTDAAASAVASGEALTPLADKDEKRKQLKKGQSVKKRPGRKSVIARNKDSKPKDEKEVMNFFDNLLKK